MRSYADWDALTSGVRQAADLDIHHLIEVKWADMLGIDARALPGVIVDRSAHQGSNGITSMLKEAAKSATINNPQDLWNFYKDVYKARPDWLDGMWPYFEELGVSR